MRLELDLDTLIASVLGLRESNLLGLLEMSFLGLLEVDFGLLELSWLGLLEVGFLVDTELLTVGRLALFEDTDLLLEFGVATVGFDGSREGFAMPFVTFPFDVRSVRR